MPPWVVASIEVLHAYPIMVCANEEPTFGNLTQRADINRTEAAEADAHMAKDAKQLIEGSQGPNVVCHALIS